MCGVGAPHPRPKCCDYVWVRFSKYVCARRRGRERGLPMQHGVFLMCKPCSPPAVRVVSIVRSRLPPRQPVAAAEPCCDALPAATCLCPGHGDSFGERTPLQFWCSFGGALRRHRAVPFLDETYGFTFDSRELDATPNSPCGPPPRCLAPPGRRVRHRWWRRRPHYVCARCVHGVPVAAPYSG